MVVLFDFRERADFAEFNIPIMDFDSGEDSLVDEVYDSRG